MSRKSDLKNSFPVCSEPPALPGKVVLDKTIPSDPALVTPLVVRTVDSLIKKGIINADFQDKAQLCLVEALRNSVSHGNCGDFSKKVRLRVFSADQEWGFLVEDEGEGFDPNTVPNPSKGDSLWKESGRGLHILAHYMDRMEFFSNGSALLLGKNRGKNRRSGR